jgi:hypothetical protein
MSQIQLHILNPYGEPVFTQAEEYLVEWSIANELYKTSLHEFYGMGECGNFNLALKKYLIMDMFNCTSATTLDQQQLTCLVGAAMDGIDRSIPCGNNINI